MKPFVDNRKFYSHEMVHALLHMAIVHSGQFLVRSVEIWQALNHVIEALIKEAKIIKRIPESIVKLDPFTSVSEEIMIRLLAIHNSLRFVRSPAEVQSIVTRQELVFNSIWALIGLWHEMDMLRMSTLTRFQQQVLYSTFKNEILKLLYKMSENGPRDEKERFQLLRHHLFWEKSQNIPPHLHDPFVVFKDKKKPPINESHLRRSLTKTPPPKLSSVVHDPTRPKHTKVTHQKPKRVIRSRSTTPPRKIRPGKQPRKIQHEVKTQIKNKEGTPVISRTIIQRDVESPEFDLLKDGNYEFSDTDSNDGTIAETRHE